MHINGFPCVGRSDLGSKLCTQRKYWESIGATFHSVCCSTTLWRTLKKRERRGEETEEILLAPSVESEREREAVALSLRVRYREGPSYQREGRKGNPG